MNTEILIKSKERVQKHGEVFTPSWIVEKMLDIDGIKQCCENLTATFLEPSVGEGAFLTAILRRKLDLVAKEYCANINQFENFSLYALSALYGIELLGDNVQICVMNLYQTYYQYYCEIVQKFNVKLNESVLDSAKCIIKSNIRQGDFLTQLNLNCDAIIFSEWKVIYPLTDKTQNIIVNRTEYRLQDIDKSKPSRDMQLSLFEDDEEQLNIKSVKYRYVSLKITDVYKEEMEIYE